MRVPNTSHLSIVCNSERREILILEAKSHTAIVVMELLILKCLARR
jgi:hypothetical protein